MASYRTSATERFLRAQGHILETLADGAVLTGTPEELGARFGLAPVELRRCLLELVLAGWAAIDTDAAGRLTARLERRSPGARTYLDVDRRRAPTDAW
jgi:hypothetical protein